MLTLGGETWPSLYEIRVEKDWVLEPHPIRKGFWLLAEPYKAEFVTDFGVFHLSLRRGWITDKRSGSWAVDMFVPKDGNKEYNACIAAHDTCYSGWFSQAMADAVFVRQGFSMSGGCSDFMAGVAYNAVRAFGKAYHMEDRMPPPYTRNREYENMALLAK